MNILLAVGMLVLSYIIGSIPFGMIIVKLSTGKDIRQVASGRTGGTNAMRAAGFWAGLGTALMDLLKAASTVWLAKVLFPIGHDPINTWVQALAPVGAILGHNYSLFLASRDEQGRLRLHGGAGGAPCTGGALGLWAPSILFILPVGAGVLFGVGYASLATLSAGLTTSLLFVYLAYEKIIPWPYVIYGVFAFLLLAWSLRPNIKRLIEGNERLIGWRAKRKEKQIQESKRYVSSST